MRRTIAKMLLIGMLATVPVAYAGAQTLDEITSESDGENDVDDGDVSNESDREFINELADASDIGVSDVDISAVKTPLEQGFGYATKLIMYIVVAGIGLRIALDLAYIVIPFSRSLLANGYMGNSNAAGAPGSPENMTGGYGNEGYGNSYGGGRYGGGSRYGGGGRYNEQSQTAMANRPVKGKIQWVSNAALNSVACESALGPDGQANSPWKVYIKDMLALVIIAPIILFIAATGLGTQLGFAIARGIEGLVQSSVGSWLG